MLNTNDLKETKDFDYPFIPKEQRLQAEYLVSQGWETYIEGPYNCTRSGRKYCYVWAVNLGTKGKPLKIDGRGYNVN